MKLAEELHVKNSQVHEAKIFLTCLLLGVVIILVILQTLICYQITTVEDDIIINKLDKKVSILNNFSGIPDNWKSSFSRISWNTCTI